MLAASAALSATALAFAPPLDRPLHYELTERRPRPDGTIRSATLTQEVVFASDPGGYVMTIRTTGYRAAPHAGGPDAFDTVMTPMVGGTVRIRVSRGGVPERVVDGAASWSAMLAALRAVLAAHPSADPGLTPARTIFAALEAMPPAARDARLIAAAGDVLGTRLPPLAIGSEASETGGTIARVTDVADEARYREGTTQVAADRSIETNATIAVSRATGLVTHSLRRTAIAGTPTPVLLGESEITLLVR